VIGGWSTDAIGWTLVASVGKYEEVPRQRSLNVAEEKYSLLISMDLIGLAMSMRIRTSDRSTSQMAEAVDVTMMAGSFYALLFAGCCRRDS
jgi:hypothetical protein